MTASVSVPCLAVIIDLDGTAGNFDAPAELEGLQVLVRYGYNHGEPVEASQPDRVIDRLDELG